MIQKLSTHDLEERLSTKEIEVFVRLGNIVPLHAYFRNNKILTKHVETEEGKYHVELSPYAYLTSGILLVCGNAEICCPNGSTIRTDGSIDIYLSNGNVESHSGEKSGYFTKIQEEAITKGFVINYDFLKTLFDPFVEKIRPLYTQAYEQLQKCERAMKGDFSVFELEKGE